MIRALAPSDAGWVLNHFLRLHPDDRRLRFCGPVDVAHLRDYAATIFDDGGIVLGHFAGTTLCGVGELHRSHAQARAVAEIAFSVDRAFQGQGIGTALLQHLVDLARDHGFNKLHLACLQDNLRVQQMARKLSSELIFIDGTVEAEITSPPVA